MTFSSVSMLRSSATARSVGTVARRSGASACASASKMFAFSSRVVAPAPCFRVFLAVDPSFGGDVSRATRNRCARAVGGGAPPDGFRAAGYADAAAVALSRSAAPRLAWADALAGRAEPRSSVAAVAASGAWSAWPPLADEASALGADLAAVCDPARVDGAALAAAVVRVARR